MRQNNINQSSLSANLSAVEKHPKFDDFLELGIINHMLEHITQSLDTINDDKLSFSCKQFMKQVEEKIDFVLTIEEE